MIMSKEKYNTNKNTLYYYGYSSIFIQFFISVISDDRDARYKNIKIDMRVFEGEILSFGIYGITEDQAIYGTYSLAKDSKVKYLSSYDEIMEDVIEKINRFFIGGRTKPCNENADEWFLIDDIKIKETDCLKKMEPIFWRFFIDQTKIKIK